MGCIGDKNIGKQIIVDDRKYCLGSEIADYNVFDLSDTTGAIARQDQYNPDDKNLGKKIFINKLNMPEFQTGQFCEGTLTDKGAEYYLKYCELTEKEKIKRKQQDLLFYRNILLASGLCGISLAIFWEGFGSRPKYVKSAIGIAIALGGIYSYVYYKDKEYKKLIEKASTKIDNRI